MASYEELYNMIMEESVKGKIGKAGLAINKKVQDKMRKSKDEKDFNKIEGISTARHVVSKLPGADKANKVIDNAEDIKDKHDKFVNSDKSGAKVVKKVEDTTVNAVKKTAKGIGYVGGKAIELPADVATGVMKTKMDNDVKKEFKGDPEKIEKELKANVKKLAQIKEDIMTVELIAIGTPIAIATAGTLDNVFRGVLLAGSISTNNITLNKAIISASVWVPYVAVKLNKIRKNLKSKKFSTEEGKKEYESDYVELMNDLKDLVNKTLSKLEKWAESDEPLVDKMTNYIAKNTRGVKESVSDYTIFQIYESYSDGIIDDDEYKILTESFYILK